MCRNNLLLLHNLGEVYLDDRDQSRYELVIHMTKTLACHVENRCLDIGANMCALDNILSYTPEIYINTYISSTMTHIIHIIFLNISH